MNSAAQTLDGRTEKETAAIIAAQNDKFRRNIAFPGETDVPEGRVVVTPGISAQGPFFEVEALRKIAGFSEFTADSDPYGWHEMAVIEVQSLTVWFKIDLYDETYERGSDEPTDPAVTRRVLTVLFPDEY